jgi:hypothetical protein
MRLSLRLTLPKTNITMSISLAQIKSAAKKRGVRLPKILQKDYPPETLFFFLHHGGFAESVSCSGFFERLLYVLSDKPKNELKDRIRLMRPVVGLSIGIKGLLKYAEEYGINNISKDEQERCILAWKKSNDYRAKRLPFTLEKGIKWTYRKRKSRN